MAKPNRKPKTEGGSARKIRTASGQEDVKCFDTDWLRETFLIDDLFRNAGNAYGSGTDTISMMGESQNTDMKERNEKSYGND